jgi:hypothetical protein
MSTKPIPKSPAESQKRHAAYLAGAAALVAAIVVGVVIADHTGAARDENRARSNESHTQDPPVNPSQP